MHAYTLVELYSNRIGLLIVELRPLDNAIHSRAKHACSQSNWIMRSDMRDLRSAHVRDLFPGP